jgi:hypothetical protein
MELNLAILVLREGSSCPFQIALIRYDERYRPQTMELYKRPTFISDILMEQSPMDEYFPWNENVPVPNLHRFKWLFRCTYYTYIRGLFNLEGLLLRKKPLSGEAIHATAILAFSDLVDRNISFVRGVVLQIGDSIAKSGKHSLISKDSLPKRHWIHPRFQLWFVLFDQPWGQDSKDPESTTDQTR